MHYDSNVNFIYENHIGLIKSLKKQNGKDIWLIGGGQINTLLLKHNLIDQLKLFIMPILLPEGIELFSGILPETKFILESCKNYNNGVSELTYNI